MNKIELYMVQLNKSIKIEPNNNKKKIFKVYLMNENKENFINLFVEVCHESK